MRCHMKMVGQLCQHSTGWTHTHSTVLTDCCGAQLSTPCSPATSRLHWCHSRRWLDVVPSLVVKGTDSIARHS